MEQNTLEHKLNEEQEIVSLLASLVRSHYLEKSSQYHLAMDFERLFKLDKLDNLKHLKDLDQLSKLSSLKYLDDLKDLKSLEELDSLKELKSLDHLSKLGQLQQLDELKELAHLRQLERMNQLANLQELSRLSELERLNLLNQLTKLENLKELDKLAILNELKELGQLSFLEKLERLNKLDELKRLDDLTKLHKLDKLDIIAKLDHTLLEHQGVLEPLKSIEKLENLSSLSALDNLSELKELQRLNKLQELEKLDRIEDAKFAERLDMLEKIDILKQESRKLVVHQVIGTGLDLLKITIVSGAIFLFLSFDLGRDLTARVLPALGFGNSGQINLALRLLANETTPDFFHSTVSDLRKRIQGEINNAFSENSFLSLQRRMEVLDEVLNYSFSGNGVDLKKENLKALQDKLDEIEVHLLAKIDYEMAMASGRNESDKTDRFRTVKILLMQKQFPQILERSLPYWEKDRTMTKVSILSASRLLMNDPKTLKEILRTSH